MTAPPEPGRRLAAVWFADIVGYTSLSARDEDGALDVVAAFQRVAEEVVTEHSGRVVKYIGDAALAEFASTDGAIRSALALMERFIDDEAVRPFGSTLRIGVNVGEVISSSDGDIYGDGVNLASRLQNQAAPGQVIASEAVHAQIRQRPVFRTEALGNRAVKGIAGPVTLYAVTLQEAPFGLPVPPTAAGPADPARRKSSSARTWGLGLVGLSVAVAAFVLLDPGGFVGRLLPGAGASVSVAQTTYSVVEGGMEIGGSVTVLFTGAIDQTTATSENVRLLDPEDRPVPAQVSVGADQRTVVLDPTGTLAFGTTYTLVLGDAFRAAGGGSVRGPDVSEEAARFTIRTQPIPVGAAPVTVSLGDGVDAAQVPARGPVQVRFSEAIDPRTASNGGVRLTDMTGEPVEVSLVFTDDDRGVRLEPTGPLAPGGRYTIRVDSTVATATGLAVVGDTFPFQVAEPAGSAPDASQQRGSAPSSSGGGAAARPAGTGPATLNLTVVPADARPFLKVVLDGDTLGPPPIRGRSLAEGGTHSISIVGVPDLSAYSLVVYRRDVAAEPGQVIEVTAEITSFGSIDVVSEPVGTVFVDGRQIGRTPLAGYPVTAGVIHRIEIRPTPADEGRLDPFTAEFRVEPLEWKSLGRLVLPPKG